MFWTVGRKGLSKGLVSVYGQKTFSSAGSTTFQSAKQASSNGGSSMYKTAGTIFPSLTVLAFAHHKFSTSSIIYAESRSASSSVFRQADSSAYRKPGSQLLFMSVNEENRDEWQHWIGYFRQAGFDCIDFNLALKEGEQAGEEAFSEELCSQIRLMALQRPPLLFAVSEKGAKIGLHHIQSSQPKVAGMVLICPKDSDLDIIKEAEKLDMNRLRIFILTKQQGQEAFRQTEKWMDAEGLS